MGCFALAVTAVIAASLLVPPAAAEFSVDAGVASIWISNGDDQVCGPASVETSCVLVVSDNGTGDLGDDEIIFKHDLRAAQIRTATIGPVGRMTVSTAFDNENFSMQHPVFETYAGTDDLRDALLYSKTGVDVRANQSRLGVLAPQDTPLGSALTFPYVDWDDGDHFISFSHARTPYYGLNPVPSDEMFWNYSPQRLFICGDGETQPEECFLDEFSWIHDQGRDRTPNVILSLYFKRVDVGADVGGLNAPAADGAGAPVEDEPELVGASRWSESEDSSPEEWDDRATNTLGTDDMKIQTKTPNPSHLLVPFGPHSTPLDGLVLVASLLLPIVLLALYRRLHSRKILDHPVRAAMVDIVKQAPGITVTDAGAAAGVDFKTALHHAQVLADYGHVDMSRQGRFIRLFENHSRYGVNEKRYVVAFESDSRRRITKAILLEPGITQRELRERLEFAKSTVNFHVTKLAESGIVQPYPERRQGYFVAPDLRNKVIDALVTAAESPLAGRSGYHPADASGARGS